MNGRPETVDKTSEKPFGWLDRKRWVLQTLEEAIKSAREMSQAKKGRGHDKESRLEWTKTLAKLLELYDQQLSAVKVFLHGHTGPGIENDEPGEQEHGLVLFERKFHGFLMGPWTGEDLNLTCQDCGAERPDVWERSLYLNYRGLKPAGSSGQSATPRHDPCGLINPILLTQFLSNLKDGASLLN